MTPKYTEDKRLLGALDYIDDKFIAEVTEGYKIFEESDGKISARRTLKISLRQFAALAACLILLSAAFPVVNYVVKVISSSAAGWGSLNEYGSKYDRAIDAYPDDMPVEDIYEDILKGGWVVIHDKQSKDVVSIDLWLDFLNNVEKNKSSSVLIAYYSETPLLVHRDYSELSNIPIDTSLYESHSIVDGAMLLLVEIEYDRNVFIRSEVGYNPIIEYNTSEYLYLNEDPAPNGKRITYYLSNEPNYSPKPSSYEIYWANLFQYGVISVWRDE